MKSNKKSVSTSSVPLKQGTLSFPSAKRTTSSANKAVKGKEPLRTAPRPAQDFSKKGSTDGSVSDYHESSASVSQEEDIDSVACGKKEFFKGQNASRKSSAIQEVSHRRDSLENSQGKDKLEESLETQAKSGKWNSHYAAVRRSMGHLNPSKYFFG
jgi:hypothetical protein